MKKSVRNLIIAATFAFSTISAFPAMAADYIEDISLSVISYIKDGDTSSNVSVKSLSHTYEVDDVDVTNEPSDGWEEGDNPKLKITLTADGDDYKFPSSISKSDVTVKGNDATVTKVTRSSSTKLYVYLTLDDVEEEDDSDYSKAQGLNGLPPQIPESLGSTQPPADTAAGQGSAQGAWAQDSRGWRWNDASGNIIKSKWQQINNKWYYFDGDGYMVTGWHNIDGKWYYMDENGEMLHDTVTPDGYTLGSDGAWIQ